MHLRYRRRGDGLRFDFGKDSGQGLREFALGERFDLPRQEVMQRARRAGIQVSWKTSTYTKIRSDQIRSDQPRPGPAHLTFSNAIAGTASCSTLSCSTYSSGSNPVALMSCAALI